MLLKHTVRQEQDVVTFLFSMKVIEELFSLLNKKVPALAGSREAPEMFEALIPYPYFS